MTKPLQVYLSNRLEILYQQLKHSLFGPSTKPLKRRLVMVYGPAMKNWLSLRMAQDPELNVAMGIEFIYLGQGFEFLLNLHAKEKPLHFPSRLELSFAIEGELRAMIQRFPSFDLDEQSEWAPVMNHLNLQSSSALSRKMEKRLIALSDHVAQLFQEYGRFALDMVLQWEKGEMSGWQPRLWRRLFKEKKEWGYSSRDLKSELISKDVTLNIFSISFISASEYFFLNQLSSLFPVHYYLLSPCAVFWSDIQSDRENAFLEKYWQRKWGQNPDQLHHLEELLRDRNPLLANFGRIGREMVCQIEESQAQVHALYALPAHVQELDPDLTLQEDLLLTRTESHLTLLHILQADLLLMRNPQGTPFNLESDDRSIQLHLAPCRRREVEILYHNILKLMLDNPSLCPGDVIVMAPQIDEYAPYIESIFGSEESQLNFQLIDLGVKQQSKIVQGFSLLLDLCNGKWDAKELLQLFCHSAFQRCHQISSSDYEMIQNWIEESGIRWGDDLHHRNALLEQRHCKKGMADDSPVGTWDYGISRLMLTLTTLSESSHYSVQLSDSDLFGRWVRLLHAMRDDLAPLHDGSRMSISDWASYLNCLLESYFKADEDDPQSLSEYEELKNEFETLRRTSFYFQNEQFSFQSIKARLDLLLDNRGMIVREEHVQAVRFCSLLPLRSIPAKAVALIGMQEGAFPRVSVPSSMDLRNKKDKCDYSPLSSDFDRYLFLEALHSAQDYLLLSYCVFDHQDHKETNSSLVVQELFSYLNAHYTIQGEKIIERCLFKHPFDSFDPSYFALESRLNNFSMKDFNTSQVICRPLKSPSHQFVRQFSCQDVRPHDFLPSKSFLQLNQLISVAKDPIKFHFNKALEMYFEDAEERKIRTEEDFLLGTLETYKIKQKMIKEPIEDILSKAESEGRLPLGIFKEVAEKKMNKEWKTLQLLLEKHSLNPSDIFEIEFSANCQTPYQDEKQNWIVPAVNLCDEEGYELSIIGKIPLATNKGLLALSKDSLSDVWKTWPQFLLYCHAAKMLPGHLKEQLIPLQASKIKATSFDDPLPHLKNFVNYYALCLKNVSPLLPDFVPLFLQEDEKVLQAKIKSYLNSASRTYRSPYHQWIFDQTPLSSEMIASWKNLAQRLTEEMKRVSNE